MAFLGQLGLDDGPGIGALERPLAPPRSAHDQDESSATIADLDPHLLSAARVEPRRRRLRTGIAGHDPDVGTDTTRRYGAVQLWDGVGQGRGQSP